MYNHPKNACCQRGGCPRSSGGAEQREVVAHATRHSWCDGARSGTGRATARHIMGSTARRSCWLGTFWSGVRLSSGRKVSGSLADPTHPHVCRSESIKTLHLESLFSIHLWQKPVPSASVPLLPCLLQRTQAPVRFIGTNLN